MFAHMTSTYSHLQRTVRKNKLDADVIGRLARTTQDTTNCKTQSATAAAVFEACYPTPPPSPDFDLPALSDSSCDPSPQISTPPTSFPSPLAPPVAIWLDDSDPSDTPFEPGFRLTQPKSLLSTLGGKRVLSLGLEHTIWDRMPYAAAAAAIHARQPAEEDVVEAMIAGENPENTINSIHFKLRSKKSQDRINAIYVQPPTPERDGLSVEAALLEKTGSSTKTLSPQRSPGHSPQPSVRVLPFANTQLALDGTNKNVPIPLQVLPEVRSPPRRTIALAADSLQLSQKRGRRPRLFGFTEIPSSGSSASSSVANSRQCSPERVVSPLASPTVTGPATSSPINFIPRRHPTRAKSETSLPRVSSTSSIASTSSQVSVTHTPLRKRENGLKLDFTGIIPIQSLSESQSAIVPSPYSARLIRKKSGEILKPALKYGGPLASNGTPLLGPQTEVETSPHPRFESKSCPTTPSCPKYVHFDTQLERVKLFLHDQKPQVVSRSGSPNADYTTSEGEEYPFPSTDDERDDKRVLQIKLPNFPTAHVPDADLYLESLFLDDDRKSLRGMILCKNLAFQKWVAVRFTLDFWQTTSEVTATHKDAVKGGKYDRFSFVVKLHDVLPRIEEKTMFLAIRYNTDGREIWDSNAGQNYQVLFEKVRSAAPVTTAKRTSISIQPGMGQAVGGRTSQWSVVGGNVDDRLADLRAKLDRLSADDYGTSPPQLSPNRDHSFAFSPRRATGIKILSPSGSPARSYSTLDQPKATDLPTAGPALAARYDFGTAIKNTRKTSPQPKRIDLPEVQTGLLNFGRVANGHASTEFYSPRLDVGQLPDQSGFSDHLFSPSATAISPQTVDSSNMNSPLTVPGLTVQGPSPPPTEDMPTPTTVIRPPLTRITSAPPVIVTPKDSPPSLDTPTGSVSDVTPSDSPRSPAPEMAMPRWSPTSTSSAKSDMSNASYSSFIEQFCWGGVAPSPPETRRTHSSSSLDAYFANAMTESASSPGTITPKASSFTARVFYAPAPGSNGRHHSGKANSVDLPGTPSSTSSYYTSFTSTPTTREDMEAVDNGLRSLESSPGFKGLRLSGVDLGRMSPPVAC